jgi:hypothetical protein
MGLQNKWFRWANVVNFIGKMIAFSKESALIAWKVGISCAEVA